METDLDLPALIACNDHLNVLRYIRVHQLREPELVVQHGKYLLGDLMNGKLDDELVRLASLEQICLAGLDCGQIKIAEMCLNRLQLSSSSSSSNSSSIDQNSIRFRLLVARCFEADGNYNGAEIIYNELLKDNPSNLMILKRKYCILKSQVGKTIESATALNVYIQQNLSDTSAWYELAKIRINLGDYKSACYCYEEVLLGTPTNAIIHCELAECYATIGNIDDLLLARKHMCQAIELDSNLLRAQLGLIVITNSYISLQSNISKKDYNEFEVQVSQELMKYSSELVLKSYKDTKLFPTMEKLMKEYTENL